MDGDLFTVAASDLIHDLQIHIGKIQGEYGADWCM
jgi:hypothetical protein